MQWGEFENNGQISVLEQAVSVAEQASRRGTETPLAKRGVLQRYIIDRVSREKELTIHTGELSDRRLEIVEDDIRYLDTIIPKMVSSFMGTAHYPLVRAMQEDLKKELRAFRVDEEQKWQSIIKQFD